MAPVPPAPRRPTAASGASSPTPARDGSCSPAPACCGSTGALEGLRALAAAGNLGVANTWGAKGVFNWDSPHHLGTVGLQADDFELLGFGRRRHDPRDRGRPARARRGLRASRPSATRTRRPRGPRVEYGADRPRCRRTTCTRASPRSRSPATSTTRCRCIRRAPSASSGSALHAGGLVTATPGVAGLWVARTFPTPALAPGEDRRVVVPPKRWAGDAVRPAVAAARAGRPTVVVAGGAAAPRTTARRRGRRPRPHRWCS